MYRLIVSIMVVNSVINYWKCGICLYLLYFTKLLKYFSMFLFVEGFFSAFALPSPYQPFSHLLIFVYFHAITLYTKSPLIWLIACPITLYVCIIYCIHMLHCASYAWQHTHSQSYFVHMDIHTYTDDCVYVCVWVCVRIITKTYAMFTFSLLSQYCFGQPNCQIVNQLWRALSCVHAFLHSFTLALSLILQKSLLCSEHKKAWGKSVEKAFLL